VTTELRG